MAVQKIKPDYIDTSTSSNGQVLTSNGTVTYWANSSGGGGFTNGQSISVNNFVITGAFSANSSNGTAGYVLASNGSGTYWTSIPSYTRVSSSASITSPLSWNSDSYDMYIATAQSANLTINADSGSPINGQRMLFRFKDDGTARTLTFTTGVSKGFRSIGTYIPTSTVAGKIVYVGCIYNSDDSRWDVIATGQEA